MRPEVPFKNTDPLTRVAGHLASEESIAFNRLGVIQIGETAWRSRNGKRARWVFCAGWMPDPTYSSAPFLTHSFSANGVSRLPVVLLAKVAG
jgi:hypothetical protein